MIARCPGGEQLLLWRAERHARRVQAEHGAEKLLKEWVERYGWSVQAGPFLGMNYCTQAHGSVLLPKLVGSYEAELHAAIDEVRSLSPSLVVDVGAAEGFYAVGLARLLAGARVVAFETSLLARMQMSRLARENGVSANLESRSKCDHAGLNSLRLENSVLICDCEGAEILLLDPAPVPGLAKCSLLIVELHENQAPGVGEQLALRFRGSHLLERIRSAPRCPEEWLSAEWPESKAELLLSEWRSAPQEWLVARRRRICAGC